MTVQHIVRRTAASAAAVNTAIACDLPIDSTASTPIISPGGLLREISFSVTHAGAVAVTTGVVWSVRLSGGAMIDGPQDFSFGALVVGATDTAGYDITYPVKDLRADGGGGLSLKVNQPLTIQVFMNGVDIGTPMGQVELVIES